MKIKITYSGYRLSFRLILISLWLFGLIFPLLSQQPASYTSYTPGRKWLADDGVHIDCHGGNIIYIDSLKTFFWYGEHRGQPRGASCYSSTDLYNWKNEGVVLEKGDIQTFERPKVVYDEINRKYVMWFHYDGNDYTIAELGVAVSDKPTGPFIVKDHYRPMHTSIWVTGGMVAVVRNRNMFFCLLRLQKTEKWSFTGAKSGI